MANRSFITGMLAFFGKLPGQSAMDFGKELKALSHTEKAEFHSMLVKQEGYESTDPPTVPKTNE